MRLLSGLGIAVIFCFMTSAVWAGGAIQTNIDGLPLLWDVGEDLVYNSDAGGLRTNNSLYGPAETRQMIRDSFNAWVVDPNIDLNIIEGAPLNGGVNVDGSNFQGLLGAGTEECYPEFFGTTGDECVSPIIIDEDGEILDSLFGECSKFSILGFAGFDDVADGSGDSERRFVRRGQALFSGACLPDEQGQTLQKPGCGSCQRALTDEEIRTIMKHEVGHLMGMDHSQVNPGVFSECQTSPTGCPDGIRDGLPTMFPILVQNAEMLELHADDLAYFRRLYGTPNEGECSVSGTIFADDGSTELRGVEVVAFNTANGQEITDAIAFVSGAEAPKFTSFGRDACNCTTDCGKYLISGLKPGNTYQICVQRISQSFNGGSSIEPVDPPLSGFSDECPAGLTVTCDCPSGANCPEIPGINVVTDADPAIMTECLEDNDFIDAPVNSQSSGGCGLQKPHKVATFFWNSLRKSLLNFSG